MKTVYIPKGETVRYESLMTEHLVVHGWQYKRKIAAFLRLDHDGGVDAAELDPHLRFLPKLF